MAYQLPPHTDQFYATDIPMYYNNTKSKLDILKEHPSYPYLDTSKVTFGDISESAGAHYDPSKDLSVLNLMHTDPQNIRPSDLKSIGHETVHRTLDPVHGIPAASNLLKGSIEPYDKYSFEQYMKPGPKRAETTNIENPLDKSKGADQFRNEHLLLYAIENLDSPKSEYSDLWYPWADKYERAFTQEIAGSPEWYDLGYSSRQYYPPRNAFLGNAPGEVRRGYYGLRELFDRSALKYQDIMKNYGSRRAAGPMARARRSTPLGDASIAERIAAQDRAKKRAAIQEAVNIQIGTSRGGDDKPSRPSRRDRGRARRRGETGQIAGGHHFSRGGLMDIPLPGRSRDI